ncbi:bifunctional homocysteine S-methyltransferase/methylenetetrahydrofolate reductase [Virgibacillus pantothenticus]|uniref:Homocysteine methyltransferase n=1 Tax=Virgibacillus pantothenticus TaxID=1473 RepID=A0A0L0QUN4_VIRPA|nr:bifunctional homocysteine S-methyltransferase/methylenetetrahydrofolate reductase [Virgibacillus pantothenticus]KNE22227.1 homocysteine methyltransferase [Virgibacillus pantothenticus]MED3735383.1 bifunctional homocysteine S-methyltransferase/methylenetetrahydrofolate reductase [Virgibacillus pantothenticus]QTY16673.1 bifunctional homocysteine S-methyltransferase/methylenetetrahydrofolate reductase [Virgibacillus pantothenticus]SIT12205.1 homocysteine S-methyltransferase [Virgibacillus panto
MSLLQQLQDQILIADGAMGTMLYSYGIDQSFEQLNITHPDQVQQVHEAYIHAGATVIQTNTYGANYIKLARYGLEEQVKKINQKAVQIAKQARQKGVYVLGSIGGIHGVQALNETKEEIKRSFREQLYCLLLEGIDGLILETYYNLDELTMVLEIAREETEIPIIANVSMHVPGVLENGTPLAEALQQLESLGADLVGVNCRFGPSQIITSLQSVPLPKKAFLAAYPNASLPAYRDGVLYYKNEPAYFKQCAGQLREQGVRLLGGCCGTTPDHIKALAEGLKDTDPITEKVVEIPQRERVILKRKRKEKSLAELAKERHTIIVELDAPKHLDMTEYYQGIRALKKAGIDAVTLADNSLATPRICNVAVATIIKEQGIRPLVHLSCRDRNLIGLQSHLMGLDILGIHEILAITGDPTKIGSFPGATSVFDVNSFKLIELIKRGNKGMSFSGDSLREHTSFTVGAAFNPNVNHVEKSVARLERKIASGADYIMTQPVYSKEKIIALKQATSHIETPIFIGIMPLTSTKNAEFLHHEVPGIKLTDEVRSRMKAAKGNREQSTKESIAISKELLDTAFEHFHGIYLITPFMRYDMIVELVNYIHQKTNAMRAQASLSSY